MRHSTEDPFSRQSGIYAAYRPVYPENLYRFIFRHLNRKYTAWDAGTGSGQVAGYLASFFDTVYASDISRAQLRHAPERENIIYDCFPAEKTGYPSGCFDLVTAAQAIHWFAIDRFYKEVKRVARNDALLAVFGYGRIRVNDDLDILINRIYDRAFGTFYGEARRYVEQRYQTLPFPFEEIPSPEFEIRDRWNVGQFLGYTDSWSATQAYKKEQGVHPGEDIIEEIHSLWPENRKLAVTFPVFLRLGKVS